MNIHHVRHMFYVMIVTPLFRLSFSAPPWLTGSKLRPRERPRDFLNPCHHSTWDSQRPSVRSPPEMLCDPQLEGANNFRVC